MASLIYHFLEDIIFKICDWIKKFCGIKLCCSSVYVIMRFIIMKKKAKSLRCSCSSIKLVISLRSAYDHDIYHPPTFSLLFSSLFFSLSPPLLFTSLFFSLSIFFLFFLRLKSGTANPVPTVAAPTGLPLTTWFEQLTHTTLLRLFARGRNAEEVRHTPVHNSLVHQ